VADLVLETPEGVALRFELAGPGTRLLAAAVDGLLFLAGFLAALLVSSVVGLGFGTTLLAGGLIVLVVAYWFGTSLVLDGRTPGKVWIGIRVCDAEGFAPRASQLFLRALFVPLEAALVLPVPLVWVLIAATPRRQRLGDLVAGTLVLRERPRKTTREPVPGLAWSELETHAFEFEPAAVRRLGGRDLGLLRELLTRYDLDPGARDELYRRAALRFHARVAVEPRTFDGAEARTYLRELFLLLRELRTTSALPELKARRAGGAAGPGATPGGGSRPR
jgi:uncharacterized RDD family membrane protein YckC